MSASESFSAVNTGNSAPVSAAAVHAKTGGRRRSAKKLRLVKKRTVRRMLKKMRGGDGATGATDMAEAPGTGEAAEGGRRHRKTAGKRKSHRRSSKFFGVF